MLRNFVECLFCFGIILNVRCKDRTENLWTLYSVSPDMDILHDHGTFVKTKKQALCITMNETRFYLISPSFPVSPVFWARIQFWIPHCI